MSTIILQDHREPWVGDRIIWEGDSITLAASAARSVVVSYTVPPNEIGLITMLGTGLANPIHWPDITWAVTLNGVPVYGLTSLVGPFSPIVAPSFRFYLPIRGGDVARVVATNAATVAIADVSALLGGHLIVPTLPGHFPGRSR